MRPLGKWLMARQASLAWALLYWGPIPAFWSIASHTIMESVDWLPTSHVCESRLGLIRMLCLRKHYPQVSSPRWEYFRGHESVHREDRNEQ